MYVVGGRKGLIVIPEAREGWGWSCFGTELRKITTFFDFPIGKGTTVVLQCQPSGGSSSKVKEASSGGGSRSCLEAL